MRIDILLFALVGLSACGDAVRRGDSYVGEPLIRFSARVIGPPPDYQQGDRLQPSLMNVDGGGGGSVGGSYQFEPRSFPHRFNVDFSLPPLIVHSNRDASTDPARVWYVQVTLERDYAVIRPQGRAASLNHWIAYSEQAVQVFPFGADGPPLDLPGGFVLVRRTCAPGQLNQLSQIPNTEDIILEPVTQDTAENEYRSRCGAPLIPLVPPRTRG
jgi:hypothetical protein